MKWLIGLFLNKKKIRSDKDMIVQKILLKNLHFGLKFKQIADFCQLHEVEIQGIADGEVAKGIKAYNPIISGQLSREEIELSSKDENRALQIKSIDIEISNTEKKTKKYIPLSKRQDKPDSALWLIRQHNILKDSQIAKLVGITKNSVTSIRNMIHS